MQLAIIADIHGNLPALQAVLDALRDEQLDGWIVAGDMVNGPSGEQVMQILRALDAWMILGNDEQYMLRFASGQAPAEWQTAQQFSFIRNCYGRLSSASLQMLASLPEQRVIKLERTAPIRVMHGSLDDVSGLVTPELPATLDQLFLSLAEDVLVCGHLHQPWIAQRDGRLAVNPGAVTGGLNSDPRAQYALLRWEKQAWRASLHGAPYDFSLLRHDLEESGLLAEARPLALAFLQSCQSGEDIWVAFLKFARRQAALAGIRNASFLPDEVWQTASEVFLNQIEGS